MKRLVDPTMLYRILSAIIVVPIQICYRLTTGQVTSAQNVKRYKIKKNF